jgi:hypothetical protein
MVTPQQAAAATPNATPSIWDQLFGQQGTGGGTAGAVKALGPGGTLGGLGNLVESIMRWNTMRTLANPSALASGASQLYQPMSAAMKRAIINPVTAAAQETGQIGAPGLYSQSVATALAPYQYQMQENALREYIAALEASGQAYPQGGLFGAGGPNYQGGGGYGSVASSS